MRNKRDSLSTNFHIYHVLHLTSMSDGIRWDRLWGWGFRIGNHTELLLTT
jgi:hypothetical protein